MGRFMLAAMLVVPNLCFSGEPKAAQSEVKGEVKIIPLDEVWGYEMPGTKDIATLIPKQNIDNSSKEALLRSSPVAQIAVLLSKRPNVGEKADAAFAVVGTGRVALENAHQVFAKWRKPTDKFPKDTDLSLVFFSHSGGALVELRSIEKREHGITVKYRFARPATELAINRFAIIPIGKFEKGKVDVQTEELPTVDFGGEPARPIQNPERSVSGPFSFEVQ